MASALLDASALIAWVFDEPGGRVIEAILESGEAATTPLAIAETLTTCRRKGLQMEDAELQELLASFGLHSEPVIADDAEAIVANIALSDAFRRSDPKAGSLSIADATCLAVAKRLGVPAVVSDMYWDNLDFDGVEVRQFR